jgi:hypothetical protein
VAAAYFDLSKTESTERTHSGALPVLTPSPVDKQEKNTKNKGIKKNLFFNKTPPVL